MLKTILKRAYSPNKATGIVFADNQFETLGHAMHVFQVVNSMNSNFPVRNKLDFQVDHFDQNFCFRRGLSKPAINLA